MWLVQDHKFSPKTWGINMKITQIYLFLLCSMVVLPCLLQTDKVLSLSHHTGKTGLTFEYCTCFYFIIFVHGTMLFIWTSGFKLGLSWNLDCFSISQCLHWAFLASKQQKWGLTWSDLEILPGVKLEVPSAHTRQHLLTGPSCWVTCLLRDDLCA